MDNLNRLFKRGAEQEAHARYMELRSTVLHLNPSQVEVVDGEWHGASVALMEMAVGDATVSIVVVADGTVSLYTSTGGGTLGAGEHLSAWHAGQRFLQAAADSAPFMKPTSDFPQPAEGFVRFHVRTPEGDVTGEASEESLRARRDELAPLYLAGQDVITEIRVLAERMPE
jgi:hypothetical protein